MDNAHEATLPDPAGPPQAPGINAREVVMSLLGGAVTLTAGLGILALLTAAAPRRTMGATRSHDMTWRARQQEIAQAIAQAEVDQPSLAGTRDPLGDPTDLHENRP